MASALRLNVMQSVKMIMIMLLQREALEAVKSIEVSGVTNMSSGIFAAISQFNVAFAKRSVCTCLHITPSSARCPRTVPPSGELFCTTDCPARTRQVDFHILGPNVVVGVGVLVVN